MSGTETVDDFGIDPEDHGATDWGDAIEADWSHTIDLCTHDHAHDLGDLARKAALEW